MLLILTTNMAAVTSRANQQFRLEVVKYTCEEKFQCNDPSL